MPDQYTRTRAQLGTPALDVLRRAHVAVFGIGGVGGQAVEVRARSGVGELSLFDKMCIRDRCNSGLLHFEKVPLRSSPLSANFKERTKNLWQEMME